MLTAKKILRECARPFKQVFTSREKHAFKLKLKEPPPYNQDGLICFHNTSFMENAPFMEAYQRGVQAVGQDYKWHWRVHVGLWVASHSVKLEGAFVECGVNKGSLSSSIMSYLDWNSLNRSFYLFDTFCGFDPQMLTSEESSLNYMEKSKAYYPDCYEEVKKNFSEFKNVHLIRGSVPATLTQVPISQVAYLSIDMNCARPEIEAAEYFWPKLVAGGMILLDDYAYGTSRIQQKAFDQFAASKNTHVLSLPTGQGLIIKSL